MQAWALPPQVARFTARPCHRGWPGSAAITLKTDTARAGDCGRGCAPWLLVETAWRILRSPDPELAGLKSWALQIARRGKRIAVVALARRVVGI